MIIKGIGIDIVEVKRIERIVKRWEERFLKKVFTDEELKYCLSKNNIYIHLAGRFAAKEAVIKALGGQMLNTNSKLKCIEVRVDSLSGEPEVHLSGPLQSLASRIQISNILITISHTKKYAVAEAICMKEV